MCSKREGTGRVSNCTHHLMLIKRADVSGSPRPGEALFKQGGKKKKKKVDAALKTASCTGRAGGCFPPVTCVFPAKQMFSDKTHDLIVKEGFVLPAKGKVWGKFYTRLFSLPFPAFICIFIFTVVELIGTERERGPRL